VRRRRYLRWGTPDTPVPKHPYRGTLLVYGGFAVLLVLLGWATGTSVGKAIVVAAVVFVAATSISLVRWRERLRRAARELEPPEEL
jgi:Flp pilus assembly protein TadB